MTTILRTITTTLGLAAFAAAFAPFANAGCADVGPSPPPLSAATPEPT